MISEQDFLRTVLSRARTTTSFSLDILTLMFGPGSISQHGEVIRVHEEHVHKSLPREATFWKNGWGEDAQRPFNIIHIGPVQKANMAPTYQKLPPGSSEHDVANALIKAVLHGFSYVTRGNPDVEVGPPEETVVVLDVQDHDEVNSYFGTNMKVGVKHHLTSFFLYGTDDEGHLRKFYKERIHLFYGAYWKSAFFMPDLRNHLSIKMPADWKLTQDSVFAKLAPNFEICFKQDFRLVIRFKNTSFEGHYVMPWHEFATLTWPDLDLLLKSSVDQFLRMLILQPEHQLDLADSEALVESFTKLPPWLATIFETTFQEIVPDLEKQVDHHQRVIDLKQSQLSFAQSVREALLPPFQTRP